MFTFKVLALAVLIFASEPLFSAQKAPSETRFQEKISEAQCRPCPMGYNTPAAIHLNQSWSGFFDASFLYWYTAELGLYLAEYAILNDQGSVLMPFDSFPIFQSFEYHPGFRLGIGATYLGEWTFRSEYTWLHSKTSVAQSAPANTSSIAGLGVWNVNNWFQQTTVLSGRSLSGPSIASTWEVGVNIVDLDCSRPYYEGSNLTIFPYFGLRGAWIRQSIHVDLTQAPASEGGVANLPPQPISSRNSSHSWAIGPRLGLAAHCLLPRGWRLEGSCEGSLLATCFTKISHRENAQSLTVPAGPYRISQRNHYVLNPNAELGLGIGWGQYLPSQKYHIDFLATYDFLEFWGQNGIRRMLDNFWAGIASPAGDLFFHGLTLRGRFDF